MVNLGARGVMDDVEVQDFRLSLRGLSLETKCFLISLWGNGTPLRNRQAACLMAAALESQRQRGLRRLEKQRDAAPARPLASR
jgi:hypothetical protein